MHAALLKVELLVPQARSLKSKRMILRSMKDRLRHRYNVSVSEVDGMDKWQRATLAVAAVGPEKAPLEATMHRILEQMDGYVDVEVLRSELDWW
jgi:hypothetical protein